MGIKEYVRNHIRSAPYFLQRLYFNAVSKRGYKRWVAAGKPLPACSLVKWGIIEGYKKQSGFKIFIETGTYQGDTVFEALRHFDQIYSIELDMDLYKKARKRFRKYRHVEILQGDSGRVLQQVINELDAPAVFWLDGHYSGGITALGEKSTPIFEELKTIFSKKHNHAILIDDARLFIGDCEYPTLEELRNFVHQYYPNQDIKVSEDCIQMVLKN